MHLEAQETSVPEPAERTYAEDLELLFGDTPVADAPQIEPPSSVAEAVMETPMLISPEGEEDAKAEPGPSQQAEAAPEGLLGSRRKCCPLPYRRMRLPSRCRNLPRTAPDRTLAFVPVAVPDVHQRRRAASGALLLRP